MIKINIKYYRKSNKIRQKELAAKLNVSQATISLWEHGETELSIHKLIDMSKIFNCTVDALLNTSGSVENPVENVGKM